MKLLFKNKILVLGLLFVITLSSCEDVVHVDLNDENVDLVSVEAYLDNRSRNNVYVKLERTLPVDRTEDNPPINDAVVEIMDGEAASNTIILNEIENTGVYRIPENTGYKVVPGRTYHLKITLENGSVITASDYLEKVETLDSVKVNLSARGDYEFLAVFISSQETPGPGNFYKWDIYINDRLLYESGNLTFASDELVDGNYIYDFEIFTDFYEDEEDKVLRKGDTVYVEQLSISQAAYDYYIGMVNQAFSGSPFSVPPANLPGNLTSSDGRKVLGIFSARDVSQGNIIIIDDDNFAPLTSRIIP